MKILFERFVLSLVLLMFCFGVFAVGSIVAAESSTEAAIAARSTSIENSKDIEQRDFWNVRQIAALKERTFAEKLSVGSERITFAFQQSAGAQTIIYLTNEARPPGQKPSSAETGRINRLKSLFPIDVKALSFARLQPKLIDVI